MPGFDGTGPRGQGSMTGGGRGYCAVNLNGADIRRGMGGGSFGRGPGRGYRNCFYATGLPGWVRAQKGIQAFGGSARLFSNEQDLDILKSQAEFLKQELENTQMRIQNLEAKKGDSQI